MNPLFNYLLQASALIVLFILFYLIVFRKQIHFRLNRAFLVVGLLLSFVLPVVNLPVGFENYTVKNFNPYP